VDSFSMLPRRLTVDDVAAHRPPVSSRAAENLFWLGRYTERTEQMVRLALAMLTQIDTDDDAPASLRDALSALAVRAAASPWRSIPRPWRSRGAAAARPAATTSPSRPSWTTASR
jgi:hypothetical protein